ncbi:MAG: ABC transporter permease [Halanaerobiales bacterium]|nr:ABC transporter permease [Halanaerobiales bacterium]
MKFLWNIASKNLFRNKLRSSVSIAAIALSVCLVVIVRGFILGMLDSMVALHIQYNSGHIKIVDKEYRQKERLLSLNYPVDGFEGEGAEEMTSELEKIAGINRVVERLKFGAAASKDDKLIGMLGWGVNPEDELAFTNIEREIVEGRMVQKGNREIVLGTGILDKMDLNVGEKITIFYTTSFGSFKGSTFKIVGRVKSDLKLLDDHVIYLPLDQAQRILDMPNQVTEMLLLTPDYNKIKPMLSDVRSFFAENDPEGRYEVLGWEETNSLIGMFRIAEHIYNLIYIMLVLLASFVVINTMLMIVKERTKEIGMMCALGLKSRDVLNMFLMEGFSMGIVGSFIGVILGGIGTKILSIVGIDYYTDALNGVSAEIMMKNVFYPVFTFENLIFSFILGVVVTTIACIIPARRAARLEPTEALRSM